VDEFMKFTTRVFSVAIIAALFLGATMSIAQDYSSDADGNASEKAPKAVIHTNMGDITLEFYPKDAPKTVKNWLTHAKNGYYDGVIFHRVIKGFMMQGGDPTGTGSGGESIYGRTFEDETNAGSALYKTGYKRGVVAMANAGPNTNGSQFFIMHADYGLAPNYTIFAHVVDGMDVVDKICTSKTAAGDRPVKEVKMESITVEE
jgi:cyclophilin family peptidyl-prolyl cis-trans isomerase